MTKNSGEFWWKRIELLEAIKENNGELPIYKACKNIYYNGSSLGKVLNMLEENGFITRIKDGRTTRIYLKNKGELLLNKLKELKKIWENGK